jgi:SM-20-related protein
MRNADFFTQFGIFIRKGFFDPELCEAIRAEARSLPAVPSKVEKNGVLVVDESVRKTEQIMVTAQIRSNVEARIQALRPTLESFFHMQFTESEPPYFALYRKGAFFRPHADTGMTPETPECVRARKITVVVYLNGESEESQPESYSGGKLTFYGIIDDPLWKSMGFPVRGEPGLLVAFRANIIHEVTTIMHGERYTVISRFS